MIDIIEEMMQLVKETGLPIKFSIEIGCPCAEKTKEDNSLGISTENGTTITKE